MKLCNKVCHYSCLKCYGGTINDCASCTSTRTLQLTTSDTGNCTCLAGLNDFGNQDCQRNIFFFLFS